MPNSESAVQIVPFYAHPHVHSVIFDNTQYDETVATVPDPTDLPYATVAVTGADKGIDNVFVKLSEKKVKEALFGKSNFQKYGQASLQVDRYFNGNSTNVWFCRVLPDNATYANLVVLAKFRKGKILDELNQETGKYRLEIKFTTAYVNKPFVTEGATSDSVIGEVARSMANLKADANDGYMTLPLFYVRSIGRGKYGNDYSLSLSRDTDYEKEYGMKMYSFNLIQNSPVTKVINKFCGSLYQTTKYDMSTLISDVLDQWATGSCPISITPFDDNFETIYNFYASIVAENATYVANSGAEEEDVDELKIAQGITVETFDPIFGLLQDTRVGQEIPYYRNYTELADSSWVTPDLVVTEGTSWEEDPGENDVVSVNGVCYESIDAAIDAAPAGSTVKFVADVDQASSMNITKDVTLDLNGKSLNFNSTATYVNVSGKDAHLTIKGGKINGNAGRALQASDGGVITIGEGTEIDSSFTASVIASGGTVIVEEGAIINNTTNAAIQAQSGGSVSVNGGKISGGASSYGIKATSGGNVNITDGEISGGIGALYLSDTKNTGTGSIKISGGTVKSEGYGVVLFDTTNLVVEGGTISGVAPISTNGTAGNEKGKIVINGGKLEGTATGIYLPNGILEIHGGEISGGVGITVRGGNLTMDGGTVIGSINEPTNIGDTKYKVKPAAISVDKNQSYTGGNVNVKISGGNIIARNGVNAIAYTENGVDCTDGCDKTADTCDRCKDGIAGLTITGGTITGVVVCDKYPKGAWTVGSASAAYAAAKIVKAVALTIVERADAESKAVAATYAGTAKPIAAVSALSNTVGTSYDSADFEKSNMQRKPTNISVWNSAAINARVLVCVDPLHDGARYLYTVIAIDAETGEITYDEGVEVAIDADQYDGVNLGKDVGHLLTGGHDGDFQEITVDGVTRAPNAAEMKLLLAREQVKAFRGQKDRKILSPARVNLDFIIDANYNMTNDGTLETSGTTDLYGGSTVLTDADYQTLAVIGGTGLQVDYSDLNVKQAIYDLNEFRNKNGMTINPARGAGCSIYLDCGLVGLRSLDVNYELMNIINMMEEFDGRATSIDLGSYEIFDPISKKRIKVTVTYFLAGNLVPHMLRYGINKPFVYDYATLRALQRDRTLVTTGDMIRDSFKPDIDLIDWDVKEVLYNSRINYYLTTDEGRQVQRAVQNTRQREASALLEENNVRVLNTLKKGLEKACRSYLYEWNNPAVRKGYTTAQMDIYRPWIGDFVEDLDIRFTANEWEQERMIMHCYVVVKFKDIVKRIILEINVERPTYESDE